ncbi:MAG: serine/threonine dehydratase [Rhodospirillaceae bacterium]|nr:serine/threonine dehydratase [Rhodospirillaceae bacterium]|tara:strand:+ start:508 stop:1461 length:954 start_codon:yes stop_codon:yes gene_type:complete
MTSNSYFDLDGFQAAKSRIAATTRYTPLFKAESLYDNPISKGTLSLKLENLQPTGSFKVRGAMNTMGLLGEREKEKGLITASGGNHGLAVAYAAAIARVPALIYLPSSTPDQKIQKLKSWGASTRVVGDVWDKANDAALVEAQKSRMTYIHPFADPRVIQGQGTVALEILDTDRNIDTLVVAVGGGGLISGVAVAAKKINPNIRIIGVEPTGAPTHSQSRKAGKVVTLSTVNTRAGTLAPQRSEQLNFELIQEYVDELVLVDDVSMQKAAEWLWFELGIAAELSSAAVIAALSHDSILKSQSNICSIICGAGTDGII